MTQLSPAAQAVLDAFDAKQDEMHEVTWLTRNPDRDCIAAAIRAAADQGEIFFDAYDSPVQVVTVEDLLAIAKELEAQ